jgi:hypothetical protein
MEKIEGSTIRPVRSSAVALVGAAALVIAGCGGDDAEERERAACQARVKNAAEAAAIAKAYERGDLGTQAEVQSHFTPDDRLFDEQGHMLPYEELTGLTRGRFDDYRAGGGFPGEVREELQSASAAVRRSGYPGC